MQVICPRDATSAGPALIVQGDDDPIVARRGTGHMVRSLRAGGARLDYRTYPGSGHFDLIATAGTQNTQWAGTRLAGMPSRQAAGESRPG